VSISRKRSTLRLHPSTWSSLCFRSWRSCHWIVEFQSLCSLAARSGVHHHQTYRELTKTIWASHTSVNILSPSLYTCFITYVEALQVKGALQYFINDLTRDAILLQSFDTSSATTTSKTFDCSNFASISFTRTFDTRKRRGIKSRNNAVCNLTIDQESLERILSWRALSLIVWSFRDCGTMVISVYPWTHKNEGCVCRLEYDETHS